MSNYYLWVKLGHVLFGIVFLGNIYTGLFWKAMADRTGSPAIRAFTMQSITRSDRWFTLPGVVGLVGTGVLQAILTRHQLLQTGWLWWSIVAFSASGIIFGVFITPLQRRLVDLAVEGSTAGRLDEERYRRLSRAWEWWGVAALLLPLVVLALMVMRPRWPGLGT
jgi:uncharacterized membrane protein